MKADAYLRQMVQTVADRSVKDDICSELQDCIDDFIEAYMEQGMSYEEAEAEAVKQMGDPVETGQMFNSVYRMKFEWRVAWYILIWMVFILIMRAPMFLNELFSLSTMKILGEATTLIGILFLLVAIILSWMEVKDDLPFLWIKVSPSKHWAMPGLGVFSNSSAFAGIGIGLMAASLTQMVILYGVVATIMIFQRLYVVEEKNKKEQAYIYKECVALEDFDFRGYANIGTEKHKVQLMRGLTVKKGDYLLVVGTRGFQLIVERL